MEARKMGVKHKAPFRTIHTAKTFGQETKEDPDLCVFRRREASGWILAEHKVRSFEEYNAELDD